ncbi:putative RNA methylase family UPF0020-domain-containing protein [Spinellus fusiger]|nr:putative RNA methylase family UPF0020-domain-containing protein [Spinellus fusiger]
MTTSLSLHVVFHVPQGLEYIAIADIRESLEFKSTESVSYSSEPNTGRIHLMIRTTTPYEFIQSIKTASLLSVYSIMLVVSEAKIPESVFQNTEQTCEFINHMTLNGQWKTALETTLLLMDSQNPTFRASFHKGQLKHKVKSQELAGCIGYAFCEVHPDWKVKLTDYDQEVIALWFHSKEKLILDRLNVSHEAKDKENPVVILMGLTIPIKDPKYRNRIHVGRTSLNTCIAYCLVKLVNPQPGQVILDMCCGTGTIPIEGASKYPDTLWLGSEVRPDTLSLKAKGNLQYSGINNVELMMGDGRRLCLRKGCVDTVVCDWPWGLREASYSAIQKLYPKFIKEISKVLPTHGKAYIVTQGLKLMNRVLAYPWCIDMWITNNIIPITIGGYDVYLYILTKKRDATTC